MKKINWANKENSQRPNNFDDESYTLLNVNILDLMENTEKSFALDLFDRTGGENSIGIRLPYAIEYFKSNQPMDFPEVYYSKHKKKVGFENGRHRTVAAFQLGYEYIPMFVFKEDIQDFKNLVRTKEFRNENTSESIQEFLNRKNNRNILREEFFYYIKNKFNLTENEQHKISDKNEIIIKLSNADNYDFFDKNYLKDNCFTDKTSFLDCYTFNRLFEDLNLKEDELKNLKVDYTTEIKHNEDDLEFEQASFIFDFNEFYDIICNKDEKTLIYRVENEKGEGPYKDLTAIFRDNSSPNAESDADLNLIFHKDHCKTKYSKSFKFGFKSLIELKTWFHNKDDLERMKKKGFEISIYEVPKNLTLSSESQTIFLEKESKRIKKINLERFFRTDKDEKKIELRKPRIRKNKL